MQKLSILFLFLGNFGILLCSPDFSFEVDRLEPIKGEVQTLVEYTILRVTRRGRDGGYVISGNLIYHEDLGEDVTHMVKTTYSASGTSQFRAHPYTVQKSSICEFFKTFYRQKGQPWIIGHSDFPVIPEEGICPLPKGKYYAKDLLFDEENLPNHAPRGLWKFEQIFEKNGNVIGGLAIYAKITDKI